MWNKAAWTAWKELDQDAISEKPATASSFEALGSHPGSKRQRRPSVRLEEIGDRPAASVTEKRMKKIGFLVAAGHSRPKVGDSVATLEVEEPQESDAANSFKAGKLLKTRPLVHINNGNLHEHSLSNDDGGDGETHAARPTDLASPCSATPADKSPEPHLALHETDAGETPLQFFKSISKKGRNGNRKRGGSKAAACVKQLSSTAQSAISPNAEGLPCMKDAQGMHSDEENDARTPEGFRDCDLETSDYLNDDKEMSNSQGSKASRENDISVLKDQQEYQPLQVSEDGLSKPGQDFVEKNRGTYPPQQASEEELPGQDRAFEPRRDSSFITGRHELLLKLDAQIFVVFGQTLLTFWRISPILVPRNGVSPLEKRFLRFHPKRFAETAFRTFPHLLPLDQNHDSTMCATRGCFALCSQLCAHCRLYFLYGVSPLDICCPVSATS